MSTGTGKSKRTPLTIRVAVGSGNPCKVAAVRKAFEDIFCKDGRDVQIVLSSHSVPSGVRDQPYGDVETRQGAINRAKAAYDAACSNTKSSIEYPDFAVGLEGGLEKLSHPKMDSQNTTDDQADELWCMAWMAILGSNSKTCIAAKAEGDNFSSDDKTNPITWGYAKTGSFLLPPAICELVINENMELGHADDNFFKRVNSKHGSGTVGVLTDGEIDRADYYVHALKLALVPWVRPELYLDKYLA